MGAWAEKWKLSQLFHQLHLIGVDSRSFLFLGGERRYGALPTKTDLYPADISRCCARLMDPSLCACLYGGHFPVVTLSRVSGKFRKKEDSLFPELQNKSTHYKTLQKKTPLCSRIIHLWLHIRHKVIRDKSRSHFPLCSWA